MRNLETERLHLELIDTGDVDDVFTTLNDRHTAEILSKFTWPMTREQAQWWADLSVSNAQGGLGYSYIGRDKTSRAPVGAIGLFFKDTPDHAEVGYWVTREFQGKGMASEMLRSMIDYAFTFERLDYLMATTALDNPASCHILEKAGFSKDGMMDVERHDGSLRPSNLYKLPRSHV